MLDEIEDKKLVDRILHTDPLTMAEAFRKCARDLFWYKHKLGYEYDQTRTCTPHIEWEQLMNEYLDKASNV